MVENEELAHQLERSEDVVIDLKRKVRSAAKINLVLGLSVFVCLSVCVCV